MQGRSPSTHSPLPFAHFTLCPQPSTLYPFHPLPTTRVGLVGGLGPESTVDYYRRILEVWRQAEPGTAPSIVIDSLDVQRALRLVASDRAALIEYLAASIDRLARA